MKWFKHETDAHSNLKLQGLIDKFGLEGYGYYWSCLELIGKSGEEYKVKSTKDWMLYFKKFLNIEIEKQIKILDYLSEKNLIDKAELGKGNLHAPKLAERCDEYTDKVRRKSGQGRDNVRLEENRIEENRREKKPHSSLSYLSKIPDTDLEELHAKFDASKSVIQRKAEQMAKYCKSKGKVYKNYRSFLENGLDKDFGRRVAPKVVHAEKVLSPEIRQKNVDLMKDIGKVFA